MDKAVLLAAGRGTRMGALTGDRPKPMIELKGKPVLEHILDRLRRCGFASALIVTGYKAEMIESHFRGYPMDLVFVRQTVANGTARAALLAREFAGPDPFLLSGGDILTAVEDLRGMTEKLHAGADAVITAKWVADPWQGAAVYAGPDGRIARIVEKPAPGTSSTHWNSAGGYCFRPGVFDELARAPLSSRGEYEITSAVEQLIDAGRRVILHGLEGGWRDVGRPEDLEAAEQLVD